jgi:outer membrane autotransporter protein
VRLEDRNTPSVAKPYRRIGASAAILAILSALFPPIAPAEAACNTAGSTVTCSGVNSGQIAPSSSEDWIFDATTDWTSFSLDTAGALPASMLFQSGANVSGSVFTIDQSGLMSNVTVEAGANAAVTWKLVGTQSQQDWIFDIAGTSGPIDTLNSSAHANVTVSGTVSNGGSSTTAAIGGHTTNTLNNFSRMTGSVNILSGGLVESTSSMEAIYMRGSGVDVINSGTISGGVYLGASATLTNNNMLTGKVTTENNAIISNSGTITGDMLTGTASRIVNTGTIGGSIVMGAGSNLSLQTGSSVGGTVSMGTTGSTNRVFLTGTGAGTFDVSKFSDVDSVQKQNSGDWSLTGTSTDSTSWSVTDGGLALNAAITGSMNVGNLGLLSGNGTINGDFSSSGILAPGNSIGTMTVNGNVNLGGSGTFQVEVNAAGQSDKLVVNGTASLGGALEIQPLAGTYGFSTGYTILTATGGVTGTFATVTDTSAFLDAAVDYASSPNEVRINLTRNSLNFADIVSGGNAGTIAQLFDNAGGATGDLAALINALLTLSGPAAQNAFTQLSGVTLTAPNAAIMAGAAKFDSAVLRNAGRAPGLIGASFTGPMNFADAGDAFGTTGLGGGDAGYLGYSGSELSKIGELMSNVGPVLSAAPMEGDSGAGFWVSGYGIGGSVRGDDAAPGFVYRGGGVLSGADYRWSDETLVGLALGYGASKIDHQNSSDEGQVGSIQASLYALQTPKGYDGRLKLDGALGIARHSIEADRHLTFGGLDRTASSDHEAYELSARAGLRYAVATGTPWLVEPTTSLAYSKTYEDGYTETGAGAANLTVADDESDSFISRLGARFTRSYQDEAQRLWQPEASFAWRHEFADTTRTMDAAFAGIASPFRVQGSQADRDALEIGLGVNLLTADAVSYALNYSATLSDNETGHGLFGTVRFAW